MYRFSITPRKGNPVEIRLDVDWSTAGIVQYIGDKPYIEQVKNALAEGHTPFGVIITDPRFIEPQTVHYAFFNKDGWQIEIIEGEDKFYSNAPLDPDDEKIVLDDEPTLILESARRRASGASSIITDSATYFTPAIPGLALKSIQSANTVEQLEAAFWAALEAGSKPIDGGAGALKNPEFGFKGNKKETRRKINAAAAEIVARVKDPKHLTSEEREILVQYTGRGGLQEGSVDEYYTPTPIAGGVWDMLRENGFSNGNVLEPSAGSGVFTAVKEEGAILTAVELDPLSSAVNALLHPEENNINAPFEQVCTETPDDTYDSVVGNVPFGSGRDKYARIDKEYEGEKQPERYFISRAIDKVKPGGLVALVVPPCVVEARGKDWQKWRRMISKKAEFLGAVKLPSETFGGDRINGTSTVTDVVLFKKHPKDLINKIPDLDNDTLLRSAVIWEEFIGGQWFKKTGKKYMNGTLVKMKTKWGTTDVLKAHKEDNPNRNALLQNLRKSLGVKFKSRIDWALLSSAEAKPHNYMTGDRRYIGQHQYEYTGSGWERVDMDAEARREGIDEATYGVSSLDELNIVVSSLIGPTKLSYKQLAAIHAKWPNKLSETHTEALKFAQNQPESEQDLAFKGVLVGAMADNMRQLYNRGAPHDSERQEVCREITALIDRYGHPRKHRKIKHSGPGAGLFEAFAQAKGEDGVFSDLFRGELVNDAASGYDSSNIQSIVEHLFRSSEDQTIQPEEVAALYDGELDIKSLGDLACFDDIYLTDNGFVQPESVFLTGNVYRKIDRLTKAISKTGDHRVKDRYAKQIEKLKEARTYSKLESVKVTMSDAWLDRKYVIEFLSELGYEGFEYFHDDDEYDADWNVTGSKRDYDTSRKGGVFAFTARDPKKLVKQIENYLNGTRVRSNNKGGSAEYRDDIRALNEQFHQFLQQHDDAEAIEDRYNRTFHPELPREYSDKPLAIENLSPNVKLLDFQAQAVRRLSEEGRGIMGFGVGLGKTFTALALARYNEQMGRANRTCTVVPKAVLANWYLSANQIYGDMSGTLFVGVSPVLGDDGKPVMEPVIVEGKHQINPHTEQPEYQPKLTVDEPDEIRAKLWTIPQSSNIRRVVMADSVFSRIPLRPDTVEKYADEWVERGLLDDKDAGDFAIKRMEGVIPQSGKKKERVAWTDAKKRKQLGQKYSSEGTNKTDSFPYYEDMAFDSVIVDEAHNYKNIYSPGREAASIAYLSTSDIADRATDMAIKMAHLRQKNKNRGPILLTATPLTNSPLEVFNALSLVTDLSEFEAMGVKDANSFIRMFGRTENRMRETLKGTVDEVDALVGFENLTALRSLFFRYTHQRTAEQVFHGKNKVSSAPKAVETRERITMNAQQEMVYQDLRRDARLSGIDDDTIKLMKATGQLPWDYEKRPLFSVIRDMERVSTDPDMYYREITFTFPANAKKAVTAMLDGLKKDITIKVLNRETDKEEKIVYPKEYNLYEGDGRLILKMRQEWEPYIEKAVSKRGSGLSLDMIGHPVPPKYAKMIANLQEHVNNGGKQIVFTEEKSQHHKLQRIIAMNVDGLSFEEVGIINGTDTKGDDEIQQAADNFNMGKFRVIICNKKAEVGINLQKGTTAIHHLTLPYTPASIEQRNGRGVRQGNKAETVDVYFYLSQSNSGQSIDERKLDIIQSKANWITEVMTGEFNEAENADASGDDSSNYLDLLVDDPEERERRMQAAIAKRDAVARQRAGKKARTEMGTLLKQLDKLADMEGISHQNKIWTLENNVKKSQKILDLLTRFVASKDRELTPRGELDEIMEYVDTKNQEKPEQALERARIEAQAATQALEDYNKSIASDARAKLTAKIKAAQTALRLIDKAGNLPFDAKYIDNQDGLAVLPDGRAVHVGQYYEYISKSGDVEIIQIEEVQRKQGHSSDFVKLEVVTGGYISHIFDELKLDKKKLRYATLSLQLFGLQPFKLTSYADDELAVKVMLSKTYEYSKLTELDRNLFVTHCTVSNLGRASTYPYRRNGQGTIQFGKVNYKTDDVEFTLSELVWPDTGNAALKTELATMALEMIRANDKSGENKGLSNEMESVLYPFFGVRSEDAIREYGVKATEQDVKAAVFKVYEAIKAENADEWVRPDAAARIFRENSKRILSAGDGMGDNRSDIKTWCRETSDGIERELDEAILTYEAARRTAFYENAKTATELPDPEGGLPAGFNLNDVVVVEHRKDGKFLLRAALNKQYHLSMARGRHFDTAEDAIEEGRKLNYAVFPAVPAYEGLPIGQLPESPADYSGKPPEGEKPQEEQSQEGGQEKAPSVNSGGSEVHTGSLTDAQLARFAMMAIKAIVVPEPVSWKKGRYNNLAKANSIWLQSNDAAGGVLKKLLAGRNGQKDKYNAKYGTDPMPSMAGSWWYMPSETDIDALLSAMESA